MRKPIAIWMGNHQIKTPALVALLAGAAIAGSAAKAAQPTSFGGAAAFEATDGQALYESVCQGCHMPQGQGAEGAGHYPALAGNPTVASAEYVTVMVLYGNKGMPGFGGFLTDGQVAAVVNFVRSSWGNRFEGTIDAAKVATSKQEDGHFDPLE